MTTVDCDLCTAPVPDMAHVCSRCSTPLITDLRDIPDLDAELDVAVCKLSRMGSGGGRSSEPKMPVNLNADDTGRALKAVLATWADLITTERGIGYPLDGLAPMSRWMLGHIEWIRHHPAGADAVTEIRAAVRAVRNAIDLPTTRVYAGACNECGEGLYAREGSPQAACRTCVTPEGERLVYDVTERRVWMLATIEDLEMTAPQAAHALSVLIREIKPALIHTWHARDKLSPSSADERGRNLFRIREVAALMLPNTQ